MKRPYALAVVLFTILLSSGAGSLTTHRVSPDNASRRLLWVILGLIAVMGLHLLLPAIIRGTQQWVLPGRIAVSVAAILPAGFLMGQPFPLGIKWVRRRAPGMITWLWAVNLILPAVPVLPVAQSGLCQAGWLPLALVTTIGPEQPKGKSYRSQCRTITFPITLRELVLLPTGC